MKKEQNGIVIPEIDLQMMKITVVGDSPIIIHKWDEKAKRMMLEKQMKKATKGKEAKDPWMDFCRSLYWLDGMPEEPTEEDVKTARFGFPACGFKAAAVDAGFQQGVLAKKTTARGAFHILGDFVEIKGTPEMREDMVRVGMGTADIRYRGMVREWSADLLIRFNPMAMSAEQIVNLINMGGFANGVGDWRPAKDGSYGMFHVKLGDE